MSAVVALSSWPVVAAETPMTHAPNVELPNGYVGIPQHYLRYQQTLNSVRALLADIQFDDKTLLFAGQDNQGLYLQVGMIGRENYDRGQQVRPHKLVYGRKWRIDSDTPTSEVIQTAFLAISKAYEHEVRELLTVADAWQGKTSAPFSCHQDLPLLAANPDLVMAGDEALLMTQQDVERVLASVRFAQQNIEVVSYHYQHTFSYLVVRLGAAPLARQQEGDLGHFSEVLVPVTLQQATASELLFALLDSFLQINQRWVEETFCYQGFARFSRRVDPRRIAAVSVATRPYRRDASNERFAQGFQQANYEVDRSRVPSLGVGALARRNRMLINGYEGLLGHMPEGL